MRAVTIRGLLARKLRLALTGLAIVLGVAFVTGTLVLGDTLNRAFDDLVGTAYRHVSFQIRGRAAFGSASAAALDSRAYRRSVPASVAGAVRRLPGVADAYGAVSGYAQFVAPDGSAIGTGGKAVGFSFDPDRRLSPYRLVAGRPPAGAQVVMDRGTASRHGFAIGDRVRVLLPRAPRTFTISGIITFGGGDDLVGETLAGFDQATAQALFASRGRFQSIDVLAAPGADGVRLQREIAATLPAGVEVVSGQAVAGELDQAVTNALSFLSTALLVFALISLFVGAFTIFNTFSITVGQRTRELALLRVVGAGRRQLFASVLAEGAVIGALASVAGLGLGVVAAVGLKGLLGSFSVTLPSAPLVLEARTPVVALAVGVGVTVLSAVLPARRAIVVPPVAALVEHPIDAPAGPGRARAWGGGGLALLGAAAVAGGVAAPSIGLVAVGAATVFGAAALVLPAIARPVSAALGRPLAALLAAPGRLGRENAMRSPRRTAQTSAALMVGLALVSAVAVLGASLASSATDEVDSAVRADAIVTSQGGVSAAVLAAASRLPRVAAITRVYRGRFEVGGSISNLGAVSPGSLARTVNLHVTSGAAGPALAAGELLIDSGTAAAQGLHVGSRVPVELGRTGAATMRVGAIFAPNPLVGSYITGERFFLSHFDHPRPGALLVDTAAGGERTLARALAAYPNLTIQSRGEFESSQRHGIDQLLGLVYVLLALAVLVALIGIVNTLMLSVFERTHEIGLLRAVGMRRRQVRQMIRAESVIVALLGAIVGIFVGTGVGAALASALRDRNVTAVSVPLPSLIGFLVLSAILGRLAATWPARRAANLDVLSAIAAD